MFERDLMRDREKKKEIIIFYYNTSYGDKKKFKN